MKKINEIIETPLTLSAFLFFYLMGLGHGRLEIIKQASNLSDFGAWVAIFGLNVLAVLAFFVVMCAFSWLLIKITNHFK